MFGNPSYPTYQAFLGLGIAAAIALLLMPWWIKLLKVEGIGQQVRADGPKRHLVKQGTPTMGGVVILVAISLTCLLMGKLTTELVLVLLATLATGVLGLIDDLTSVTHGRSLGLTPHAKMIGLTIICVTFTVLAVNWCGVAPEIRFPGGLTIDLGVLSTTICGLSFPWLYIVFCWLMIAGLSNAVNLTDGLDGLAGGPFSRQKSGQSIATGGSFWQCEWAATCKKSGQHPPFQGGNGIGRPSCHGKQEKSDFDGGFFCAQHHPVSLFFCDCGFYEA